MKILFLVRSLQRGGAERQLVTLAAALQARGHHVTTASFYGGGPLQATLDAAGVTVVNLDKGGRWDVVPFTRRLVQTVRTLHPDVLHTYLTVPNLLSVLLRPLWPAVPVVWGVRASKVDWSQYDRFQQLSAAAEGRLARFADLTICNSSAGRADALTRGFPPERTVVIYNGIDVSRFHPNAEARARTRSAWGVPEGVRMVGIVGRLDVLKDLDNFVHAAATVARSTQGVRFVSVGDGPPGEVDRLHSLADSLGMGDRMTWLAGSGDIEALYPALDLLVSSSITEGFSNTVAEGMACGVPCAVTDVGDSAHIVGDTGATAPPGDSPALALAILRQLGRLSPELSAAARSRIVENFTVERLVEGTEAALAGAIRKNQGREGSLIFP